MIKDLLYIRQSVKKQKPLVHCLTNNVTINDVANVILAVGARPVMAEHKDEVVDVTSSARALVINLGNISDDKMTSIMLSGEVAKKNNIPIVFDLVGVACSFLRLNFAKNFIDSFAPNVIKGNFTEIKALSSMKTSGNGIDVTSRDILLLEQDGLEVAKKLATSYDCIVVVTGKIDIVSCKDKSYLINNGSRMLAEVTGTGCMLSGLIAAFISNGNALPAVMLATGMFGVCGELAFENAIGIGSFKVSLFDNLYSLPNEVFIKRLCVEEVSGV